MKNDVEMLYIIKSSADDKGRRVWVRNDSTENFIFKGEEDDPANTKLLGLTERNVQSIKRFFSWRL